MLAFVADARDVDAAEPLTTELLDRLTELVGCTFAAYNEFDWAQRTVTAYVRCSNEDPLAASAPYVPPEFWTAADWPYRSGAPFEKVSDRLNRRERERVRDEDEFNAEFRLVDSIGFRVGDGRTRSGWVSFDSDGRDFAERDRELVIALWPHVEALWRRAVSRRQLTEVVTALERTGDADTPPAIVLYGGDGRIDHATREAHRMLADWFATRNDRLPPKLVEWTAEARRGGRYTERRNDSVLTVEAAGDFTLILNEHRSADTGLTRREREVLRLVAQGLTNAEIARRLFVAPSTVAKHLEQTYSKLGVHSRTAAIARLAKLAG